MLLASLSSPTTLLELYVQIYNMYVRKAERGAVFVWFDGSTKQACRAVAVFGSTHGRRHTKSSVVQGS